MATPAFQRHFARVRCHSHHAVLADCLRCTDKTLLGARWHRQAYADDGTARVEITRLAEIAIASITNATTTATLTTSAAHGLTTGNSVTVYGAYPYAYNGTYTITVTGRRHSPTPWHQTPGGSATTIGHLIGPGAAVVDFTGARDDRWTGGVLGGVLVMSNGVDVPQYWAALKSCAPCWLVEHLDGKILAPFKTTFWPSM